MKPIKLENFKIPARRIAEIEWGKGGTTGYKTNRTGCFYYSCSAHGGYIIDSRVLTDKEKEDINKYIKPENLNLLVQHSDNGKFVIGVSLGNFTCYSKKTYKYNTKLGPVFWKTLPVYLFEEDCAWSILEYFTNIRVKDSNNSIADIRKTFMTWYGEKKNEKSIS